LNINVLFISRKIESTSPIRSLKEKGLQIVDSPLIQIKPLPVKKIPLCDWIFFYSKNGVKFFLEAANLLEFDLSSVKIACLGRQTATFALDQGLNVHFTGTGTGETTAGLFAKEAADTTVLFPTGTSTLDAVGKRALNKYTALKISVYDNQPDNSILIPDCQIVVLTSPMNARVFFSKYKGNKPKYLIAIGKTTAREISTWTDIKIHIPEEPSETSIYRLIDQII
jgi:uroporphyrinogen-III synthase